MSARPFLMEPGMSKDDEDDPREDSADEAPASRSTAQFAAGLAVGALLGAAVALLFAPAAGQVTRGRLGRKLDQVRERAGEEWEDLSRRARRELRRRVG